jgi:hypothetical protein
MGGHFALRRPVTRVLPRRMRGRLRLAITGLFSVYRKTVYRKPQLGRDFRQPWTPSLPPCSRSRHRLEAPPPTHPLRRPAMMSLTPNQPAVGDPRTRDPGWGRERKWGQVGFGGRTSRARGRQLLPAPFDSGDRKTGSQMIILAVMSGDSLHPLSNLRLNPCIRAVIENARRHRCSVRPAVMKIMRALWRVADAAEPFGRRPRTARNTVS